MNEVLCIHCCKGFGSEVAGIVLDERWDDVRASTFPATCGRPPPTWSQLASRSANGAADSVVIGGVCVARLDGADDKPAGAHVVATDQCIALIGGERRVAEAIAGRTYVVTPGWLRDWPSHLERLGLDGATAREFFHDFARQVLLLDTGVDRLAPQRLAEFAAAVDLPASRETVGLDLLRARIEALVLEWRMRRRNVEVDERLRRLSIESADRAAALDMLVRIAEARSEDDVAADVGALFQSLFAPKRLQVLRVVDGRVAPVSAAPQAQLDAMRAAQASHRWVGDDDDGFLLRIGHGGADVALVVVEGLAFPEYRDRYINLALEVAGVCGLAVANARRESELVRARDEAQAADRAKGAFLATISHELRTPLNAVLGCSALAKSRVSDPRVAHWLDMIEDSGRQLLGLIADVLDLTQLEAGGVEIEALPVDPARIAQDVVAEFADTARAKGLAIGTRIESMPGELVGDAARVARALRCLVDNAVKFTEQGTIEVEVSRASDAPCVATVRFDVCDRGIGIPADELARVFEPFHQVDDSSTRCHGGAGLGLAIARRLARRMGGDLRVESVPGAGSTFSLTVPFERRPVQR